MRRTALAAAFLAWLYGVPFLLVVGLIRRTGGPDLASPAADRYAAVTDRYLTAAVVLNVAVPIAGLVAARLLGDRFWSRHFGGALAAMLVVLMLFAAVMHRVSADREPAPQVTQCIPRSGGHGCPGG